MRYRIVNRGTMGLVAVALALVTWSASPALSQNTPAEEPKTANDEGYILE